MQRTKRYDTVYALVSKILFEPNTDDLVQMSDLIDAFRELKSLSPIPEQTNTIFDHIDLILQQKLREGELRAFFPLLNQAVDTLAMVFGLASGQDGQNLPEYAAATLVELEVNLGAQTQTISKTNTNEHTQSEKSVEKQTADPVEEASLSSTQADEVLQSFIHEARERLLRAEGILLDFEGSLKPELVHELFRIFHTFKGEAGFLGFRGLGGLTHELETLLDKIREHRIRVGEEVIDLVLENIDIIKALINSIDINQEESQELSILAQAQQSAVSSYIHSHTIPLGELLTNEGYLDAEQVAVILQKQKDGAYEKKFGELAVEAGLVKPELLESIIGRQKQAISARTMQIADRDALVSVPARHINYVIDMIGELLISLNQLDESDRQVQAARKISRLLQRSAMQLGTVRVGSLFGNLKRTARDAARQSGKNFNLELHGEDVEVDRTLVERLAEPLMHLVRNAIAHGLEDNEDLRSKQGKNPIGTIGLAAERRGNRIIISVSDDGKGLNLDLIRKKAFEKKLFSEAELANMTTDAVQDIIFMPGFSTAEKIDGLAGRGVGMDVVKTMVETLRGNFKLYSNPGNGLRIELSFPVNMAIVDGMIVGLASRLFVVPVASIIESLELKTEQFHELRTGVQLVNIRGQTMPVIDLANHFGLDKAKSDARQLALIVESAGKRYAMLVHEVLAKREIVIKPLGALFASVRGIAGGTILHGGKIAVVLDVDQIVQAV